MLKLNSLEPLFVFEMANNHMGLPEHGLKIIREFSKISKEFPFNFGFKLQYRRLDTFIHPDYKGRLDFKYVKRFTETRLSDDQYKMLRDEMKAQGFVTVCTPFDEESVDLIEEHDFDIIKVASCSFTDWPLLERIVKTQKPIIASTAGIALQDIDKVVSFFEHRKKDFAIMHCVAQYPTPAARSQLNQIDILKARYPQVRIGYSTHEDPENVEAVKVAVGKGVTVFEKHVGVPDGQVRLNDYSANPNRLKGGCVRRRLHSNCVVIQENVRNSAKRNWRAFDRFKEGCLPGGHSKRARESPIGMYSQPFPPWMAILPPMIFQNIRDCTPARTSRPMPLCSPPMWSSEISRKKFLT